MANENQNNNAVICAEAASTGDHDGDLMVSQENHDGSESNLKSASFVLPADVSQLPHRKKRKRKKSLERLTQIRQEEVSRIIIIIIIITTMFMVLSS